MNPRDRRQTRRGMLLLMVLLMLALFMAIGAMLLTIALRSRAAARAAMATSEPSVQNDVMMRDALDEALMAALRGATSGTNGSVTFTGTTASAGLESLLLDKYGPPLTTGSGAILSGAAAPAGTNSGTPVLPIGLFASNPAVSQPARLPGRILTITPRPGEGEVMSFRILAATGTSAVVSGTASGTTTCLVAQLPSTNPQPLPSGTFGVVVNGREFTRLSTGTTPENYDAYDDANLWLARPAIAAGQISSIRRMSFAGAAGTAVVDNDNDGVHDGVWFPSDAVLGAAITSGSATPVPFVLADRPSPLGGTLRFQVSYLILDLDGRLNVNAAGVTDAQGTYVSSTPNVPIGMGYGPADVNISALFPTTIGGTTTTLSGTPSPIVLSPYWQDLLLSGTPTMTPVPPTVTQRRQPPVVGPIHGRYGPNYVPNGDGDQTGVGQRTAGAPNPIYAITISGANAVADLKAQTRVYMAAPAAGDLTPQLNFYRPTWSGTVGADHIDDPYEVRLDLDAPRYGGPRRSPAAAGGNDDLPFSIAELERVLRPNDSDTSQLPQRLAAGLEDQGQRHRLTITTDSWDTPALTGLAAVQVETFMAANPLLSGTATTFDPTMWSSGSIPASPDIASGVRFDINRIVTGADAASLAAAKQDYCKGLYTLVMALSGTALANDPAHANSVAQWVANVIDFRDDDSASTRFTYDTALGDGWQVTGTTTGVVYGAERPEVLIAETAAWRDTSANKAQLFVTLHRPAALARLLSLSSSGTTSVVTGTTEQSSLAVSGSIPLNGWQLRLVSGSTVVQFGDVGATPVPVTQWVLNGTVVSQTTSTPCGSSLSASPQLAASGTGSYVCVHPEPAQRFSPGSLPRFSIDQGSFALSPTTASGTVQLERLADPGQANSQTNPFVVVDTMVLSAIPDTTGTITRFPRTGPTSTTPQRLASFWRQAATGVDSPAPATGSTYSVTGTNPVPWFHWPNRPFVGNAELALVPTGSMSTNGVLANYSFPTNSLANSSQPVAVVTAAGGTTTLGALILDATTVPSRFTDTAFTVAHPSVATVGLDALVAHNMSKWREPGRVNVNTIVTGTTPLTDELGWATFIGGTSFQVLSTSTFTVTSNMFTGTAATAPSPAISLSHVLSLRSLGTTGPFPIATEPFFLTSGTGRDKNPYFALARAIRLSNTATVRSNVFAVWITVRVTDDSPNAPSPVTKRLFAIIDRSIPVGYSHNRDLNVCDTIRLKRYLD